MKQYKYFFGVDVSKKTVDITLFDQQQTVHRQFINTISGMEELKQWLQELNQNRSEVMFCMETTGLYCFPLTQFLADNGIDIWIELLLKLKNPVHWTGVRMIK